jgi:TRAP-type C4-dicarboxylate transport system permease small subunit
MKSITHFIDKILERILILLFGLMVSVVTWQVFTRFLLNSPSSFTEELSTYLLIWISLLGAVYALRKQAHLGIDIITSRLSGRGKEISTYIIHFFIILFSLFVFMWGGIRLVWVTLQLNQISASLQIKIGYIYVILPISGLLMIYYSIYFLVNEKNKSFQTTISKNYLN